jgi:hypothetical protein
VRPIARRTAIRRRVPAGAVVPQREASARGPGRCARSARASTGIDLEALVARIGELGASAPLIDRTRKRSEQTAG